MKVRGYSWLVFMEPLGISMDFDGFANFSCAPSTPENINLKYRCDRRSLCCIVKRDTTPCDESMSACKA